MAELRKVQRAPAGAVESVLRSRAARLASPFPTHNRADGDHVWSASGLQGFPGGSEVNVFAQSGLRDAFAPWRDQQHDPRDWVSVVSAELKKKGN